MLKRILIIAVIIVLAAAGWYGFQQYQRQQQAALAGQYKTEPAARGDLTATVGATGVVHPLQSAVVAWQTSGTVEKVNVKVGDKVKKKQELASLEQISLPQSLILAQADLVNAQQALDDLDTQAVTAKIKAIQDIAIYESQVKDAQYQFDNFTVPTSQANLSIIQALEVTKKNLDAARRAFEPYKNKPSSDTTREKLKDDLDRAQSDYNAAVKRLEYEYKLEVAQTSLQKAWEDYNKWKDGPRSQDVTAAQARIAAAQAAIRQDHLDAPFEATVTDLQVLPGDQAAPGKAAVRLDDLSRLEVDVNISEVDVNRIKPGQEVILTFDAIPNKEYQGKVSEVAEVGTTSQGVVDFIVTVELVGPNQEVKPGMTAAVNMVVNKLENVLLVPNRAVRVRDGKRIVYLLRSGMPVPVEITLGASSETASEVLTGELQEGDPIILNPPAVFDQNGPPPFVERGG